MLKFASSELMSKYVDHLRALYLVHQNNHWTTQGNNFYSNHLLFERLYQGSQEMVDEAAEKCIGIFGVLKPGDVSSIVQKYNPIIFKNDANKYLKSSLQAEQDFQELAKKVYDELKKDATITLGLDDMIMSHASKSEVHIYLLQQSIK